MEKFCSFMEWKHQPQQTFLTRKSCDCSTKRLFTITPSGGVAEVRPCMPFLWINNFKLSLSTPKALKSHQCCLIQAKCVPRSLLFLCFFLLSSFSSFGVDLGRWQQWHFWNLKQYCIFNKTKVLYVWNAKKEVHRNMLYVYQVSNFVMPPSIGFVTCRLNRLSLW